MENRVGQSSVDAKLLPREERCQAGLESEKGRRVSFKQPGLRLWNGKTDSLSYRPTAQLDADDVGVLRQLGDESQVKVNPVRDTGEIVEEDWERRSVGDLGTRRKRLALCDLGNESGSAPR